MLTSDLNRNSSFLTVLAGAPQWITASSKSKVKKAIGATARIWTAPTAAIVLLSKAVISQFLRLTLSTMSALRCANFLKNRAFPLKFIIMKSAAAASAKSVRCSAHWPNALTGLRFLNTQFGMWQQPTAWLQPLCRNLLSATTAQVCTFISLFGKTARISSPATATQGFLIRLSITSAASSNTLVLWTRLRIRQRTAIVV